jgi:AcrR family transcriptional regulator
MSTQERRRRTKKELDETIWAALERLIIEHGFNGVTLVKLAQEAGVEPSVIYNRFDEVDELLEKYVRRYDYWLKETVKLEKENTVKANFKKLLTDLINELYDSEIMQRILVWEMNDTHDITRIMAHRRELDSSDLIQYFRKELYNFSGVSSMMIAGIYYLILHRKVSTFVNINYNSPEGKEAMVETVEYMADRLFPEESTLVEDRVKDIAKKLLNEGIDKNIIKRATGLSIDEIGKLN